MSSSKKGKLLIALILVIGLGSFVAYKIIYKPHTKTEDVKAMYSGKAQEFISLVSTDAQKYQSNIIELEGTLTALDTSSLTLNQQIFCQFEAASKMNLALNSSIKIKGRFVGYDDLLEEIKLDNCIVLQP